MVTYICNADNCKLGLCLAKDKVCPKRKNVSVRQVLSRPPLKQEGIPATIINSIGARLGISDYVSRRSTNLAEWNTQQRLALSTHMMASLD